MWHNGQQASNMVVKCINCCHFMVQTISMCNSWIQFFRNSIIRDTRFTVSKKSWKSFMNFWIFPSNTCKYGVSSFDINIINSHKYGLVNYLHFEVALGLWIWIMIDQQTITKIPESKHPFYELRTLSTCPNIF